MSPDGRGPEGCEQLLAVWRTRQRKSGKEQCGKDGALALDPAAVVLSSVFLVKLAFLAEGQTDRLALWSVCLMFPGHGNWAPP